MLDISLYVYNGGNRIPGYQEGTTWDIAPQGERRNVENPPLSSLLIIIILQVLKFMEAI